MRHRTGDLRPVVKADDPLSAEVQSQEGVDREQSGGVVSTVGGFPRLPVRDPPESPSVLTPSPRESPTPVHR